MLPAEGSAAAYARVAVYDPAGNRLTLTDPDTGAVTTNAYDHANRLLTSEDASGVTTYTYDANGNQLTIEEPGGDITTNVWDGENRLVAVEHPDFTVTSYAYNADGLKVEKDDGVAVTRFLYDGNNLLRELDDLGTVEAEFTYVPQPYAHLVSQQRDGDSSFYHFDGTRNTAALSDAAGVVTDEYEHDAWGKLRNSTGSTSNAHTWKGELLAYHGDPHAGPEESIYSLHHRDYVAQQGRFRNEDPAESRPNRYTYCSNDPVNRSDPSGLFEIEIPEWMRSVYGQVRGFQHAVSEALRTGSHKPLFAALDDVIVGLEKAIAFAESRGRLSAENAALIREGLAFLREFAAVLNETLPEESVGLALDLLDVTFSILGLVPALGEVMDALSLALSLGRQDWWGAGFSAFGLIPLVGMATGGVKIGRGINRIRKAVKALNPATAAKILRLLTLLGQMADALRKGLTKAVRSGGSIREWVVKILREFRERLSKLRKGAEQENVVIGFAKGTAQNAVRNVGRVDHAGRHLSDFGVIAGKQGTTAFRNAVRAAAIEVLENPLATFDHVMKQGEHKVKGFYGKIDGKDVVFFVAKEPRGKIQVGELVTAVVPSPQQLANWGFK